MNVNSVLYDNKLVVFDSHDVYYIQQLVNNYFHQKVMVTKKVILDLLNQLLKMSKPELGDIFTRYTLQNAPPGSDNFKSILMKEALNLVVSQIEYEHLPPPPWDAWKANNEKNTLGKIKLNRRKPKTEFYWKY